MYLDFFGLKIKPFDLVPNPGFLYQSQAHRKALNYLQYGIQQGAGFILFTGEVGSGKTTILRGLIQNVDADTQVSMVYNTRVDGHQLLAMINEDFDLETAQKDKPELLRDLNDFLIAQHSHGHQPIIIIDEAQNLSPDALEEIRLLSNLETDKLKLVQIILVGQPELRDIINQPSLRQLRQRINIHCHLEPLQRQEAENYILHRLEVAGNREAVNFQEGIFDLLFDFSGGIPRVLNLTCDFILLTAFGEGTRVITPALAEEVISEISWRDTAAASDSPDKPSTARNPLARQLFLRLGAIDKRLNKVLQSLEVMSGGKNETRIHDGLLSEFQIQNSRIEKMEETLSRIEISMQQGAIDEQEREPAVEVPVQEKSRPRLLARILGVL
jgi:putative secretion ATPase (PEP-CTERM system associated)